MKRTILSLAVIATLSVSSFARGVGNEKKQEIPHQLKNLNLTEEQGKQIKDLGEQYDAKRKALNEEFKSNLKSILTPDQVVAWEAREKNRGNKRGQKRHHKNDRNKNLDEATKEKLEALKVDYTEKRNSIEKSRVAPDTQKEQLKALHEQYRKDVHDVMRTAKNDSTTERPHSVQAFLDIAPSDKQQ